MDWAANGKGNRNPVAVVNGSKGFQIINVEASPGSNVVLDASDSFDPDDDDFAFRWWVMPESGTFEGDVMIQNHGTSTASLEVPSDASGKTIHVICEVEDNGTPSLVSYRRVIIKVL